MNWLIIAPSVKDENLKIIEEFLEKKHNMMMVNHQNNGIFKEAVQQK